jgi:hypothetical protein
MHHLMVWILDLLGDQNPPCEEALRVWPGNPGVDHVLAVLGKARTGKRSVSSVYTVWNNSSPSSMEDCAGAMAISATRGGTTSEAGTGKRKMCTNKFTCNLFWCTWQTTWYVVNGQKGRTWFPAIFSCIILCLQPRKSSCICPPLLPSPNLQLPWFLGGATNATQENKMLSSF